MFLLSQHGDAKKEGDEANFLSWNAYLPIQIAFLGWLLLCEGLDRAILPNLSWLVYVMMGAVSYSIWYRSSCKKEEGEKENNDSN